MAIMCSSISTPLCTFSARFAIDNSTFGIDNFQECLQLVGHSLQLLGHVSQCAPVQRGYATAIVCMHNMYNMKIAHYTVIIRIERQRIQIWLPLDQIHKNSENPISSAGLDLPLLWKHIFQEKDEPCTEVSLPQGMFLVVLNHLRSV